MTNNVRAAILIPGATPLPCLSPARTFTSRPLSQSKVTPESPSDPLSLRERVRVRAPHEPNQTEQSRTGSNARSHQKAHSNQPTPSKTNHPQPLCPHKTLDVRLIRPSEKRSPTTVRRPAKTLPPTFEPRARRRTPSNRTERARTASPAKTCSQADKTSPELSKTVHPQSTIPSKTLEILPVRPRGETFLAKRPESEQSSSPEHCRPNRAWRRILRIPEATRSGDDDHHQ